jgi:hypothetical protein
VSGGPGPLSKPRWKQSGKKNTSEEEDHRRGRREEASYDGATKPPTPWLVAMEVAEQALELRVWGGGRRRRRRRGCRWGAKRDGRDLTGDGDRGAGPTVAGGGETKIRGFRWVGAAVDRQCGRIWEGRWGEDLAPAVVDLGGLGLVSGLGGGRRESRKKNRKAWVGRGPQRLACVQRILISPL